MDVQLNFLQFQPLKNWLDYFLQRDVLIDLLSQPNDQSLLITLCDQFIEQALNTEKELAQIEMKYLDQEDLICMRHKSLDLWMCAASCFGACNWDLNLLNKNSNVLRVQAFLNQLTQWAFRNEQQQLDQTLLEDPFKFVCAAFASASSTINNNNVFFAWLHARWILLIDLETRFPPIPTKPTVSNPYVYVDQLLLQAEKLTQTILDVQLKVPEAVKMLQQVLENATNFVENGGIILPGKQCFYPRLDIISKGSSLSVLSNFPKPNFEASKEHIELDMFEARSLLDLVMVHFSARHFKTAKTLLEKLLAKQIIIAANQPTTSSSIFSPSSEILHSYAAALGFEAKSPPPRTTIGRSENTLMEFAICRPKFQSPTKLQAKLLANGICRIPKIYRQNELTQEKKRSEFIQAINTELNLLKRNHSSTITATQRARLLGSLYFLCSHCPGFSDSLLSLDQFLAEHQCKTRRLLILSTLEIPPHPTEAQINEFSLSDNPLWNILTSFDITILRNSFARLDVQLHLSSKKMIFSPISADPILSTTKSSGDRFFVRNQLMLWKLEQLARLGDLKKWMYMVEKFSEDCKAISENKELQLLLVFDSARLQISDWNTFCCRPIDCEAFERHTQELTQTLKGILLQAKQHKKNTFQLCSNELACYLLNNREWAFVEQKFRSQPIFNSPFTTMSLVFAFHFSKLYIDKKRDEAVKTVREIVWKIVTPTFDAQKTGQEARKCVMTKLQLCEFLEQVKDVKTISIFIGLVSFIYNFALTTDQKMMMNVSISGGSSANHSSLHDLSSLSAIGNAMDNSSLGGNEENPVVQQHNAGINLVRAVGRHLYLDNIELWQSIKMDEYRNYDIDIPYIERVLDLLCSQAKLVGPVYVPWLRFRGDYYFVRERYEEATKLYLETMMALDSGLLGEPGSVDGGGVSKLIKRMDMDLMVSKLAVSLHLIRMPTLAAIVGQMRSDLMPHLNMVDLLLKNTPATVDSGPAYFPLIADIHLMERMAVAYEHPSLDLPLYRQALLNSMPTRAINVNNPSDILKRECARRKERFMEALYKQFFGENLSA